MKEEMKEEIKDFKKSTIFVLITFLTGFFVLLFSIGFEFYLREPFYKWLASVGGLLIVIGTFFSILQEKNFLVGKEEKNK